MTGKEATHVSDKKKTVVSELVDLIKSKKTVLLASIKGIPSSQYQEISKRLRGKAVVKVPKKSIIFRAFDNSGIEELKKLKNEIKNSTAILFSDEDSFELAAELVAKKNPAKAKPGQTAPADIEIPEGPTDLIPGPAISELVTLGIKIQIEKGKIMIKEPKVIAKQGEKISQAAAEMMNKLGIKPFSVGFIPIAAFDTRERKIYFDINIDKEGTVNELKKSFSKALGFAVGIGYASEDTIKFLIQKAGRHEIALRNLTQNKSQEENK
ncbi:MAG: 50S ribosomal protein L10 [Candidatus Pacearchaeota archaeon]|nr:50S ribosomal protein L10 [Candidatus Pacearchaeota archaeon]